MIKILRKSSRAGSDNKHRLLGLRWGDSRRLCKNFSIGESHFISIFKSILYLFFKVKL